MRILPLVSLLSVLASADVFAVDTAPPEVSREVRAILSKRCLNCHGPDAKKRKADLRLDVKEGLLSPDVVLPGKPAESELIKRILSKDPEEVMPPPDKGDPVTPAELKTLQTWIKGGAPFAEHWSFVPPSAPRLPAGTADSATPQDKVDAFVVDLLARKGMRPAQEAGREVWLRRVSFDLTGLPPSLELQDAFLADASPLAYEKVVDRLLGSKKFGERMAIDWLDVARYADTYGRHEDAPCITWPYRDWVIKAFNENLPYDQFVTWQLAGDLLPHPTQDQMVATCFNRLAQQSNEAGSDPEEFRIEQVADRVKTTATAFLGLTMECARCHDHKYDPLSTHDYYSMASYFTNIDELGLFTVYTGSVPPPSILIQGPEDEKELNEVRARIAELEKKRTDVLPEARKRFAEWLKVKHPPMKRPPGLWNSLVNWFESDVPRATSTKPLACFDFESAKDKAFINKMNTHRTGMLKYAAKLVPGVDGRCLKLEGDNLVALQDLPEVKRSQPMSFSMWLQPQELMKRAVVLSRSRSGIDSASKGVELLLEDGKPSFALVHFSPGNEIRIRTRKPLPLNQWSHVSATYDGSSRASGMHLYIDGQLAEVEVVRDNLYRDVVYRPEWGDEPEKDNGGPLYFTIGGRHNDASYRNGLIDEFAFHLLELTPQEVVQLARKPDNSKPEDWFAWYLRERDPEARRVQKDLKHYRELENRITGRATDLMVMKEWPGPRRPTYVLNRGQYNQPKEEVLPATPKSLFALPEAPPPNRLGLARWLTDRRNPLTARVAVNRLWQQFFGRGLVSTAEDFGTQGQYPSHPELLDWLAVHFMDARWDVKEMCRTIVLSKTYRQSSTPADLAWLKEDPENRWLSHGPRYRLGAEQVRDMALATSGLLVDTIGGRSGKPYQPAGLWEESGTQWVYRQDHGAKLYRRSLYTYWKRTMPPPSMTIFDAPTREICKVRRERTATPLQALVLMNDPQFMEASRMLAAALVRKFPASPEQRVTDAFRLLTSQHPSAEQQSLLAAYLKDEATRLGADAQAAALILKNGESKADSSLPMAEVAATALMVRLLMNFTETTMKP